MGHTIIKDSIQTSACSLSHLCLAGSAGEAPWSCLTNRAASLAARSMPQAALHTLYTVILLTDNPRGYRRTCGFAYIQ